MKATRRRLRALTIRPLAALVTEVLGRLPWRLVQASGRLFGALYWIGGARDRRRTLEHLAIAFPDLSAARRRELARISFRHLGLNLAECLHLLSRSCRDVLAHVEVVGMERVEEAQREGRPVLVLTAHCGNWELVAAAANCKGLGMYGVGRQPDEPELGRLLQRLRRAFGSETVDRGSPGATRKLLRVLRGGGVLAMLIDQDTKVDGTWVPFFGRPAYTPLGAARLAARHRAAVIPTFIERLEDGSHRLIFHPELELPEDPREATAHMTAVTEAQIRRVPSQWVWMHKRWRRPPGHYPPELGRG